MQKLSITSKFTQITLLTGFILAPSFALAESSRQPFSQLEFDTTQTQEYQRAKLSEKAAKSEETSIKRKFQQIPTIERKLDEISGISEEGTFLTPCPNIKADSDSPDTITSIASWEKGNAKSCDTISDADALAQKARALSEIFSTYTGYRTAYANLKSSVCNETCKKPEHTTWPTSASLDPANLENPNKFTVVESLGSCHFRIAKNANTFGDFKIKSVNCSCLPNAE